MQSDIIRDIYEVAEEQIVFALRLFEIGRFPKNSDEADYRTRIIMLSSRATRLAHAIADLATQMGERP